MQKVILRADGNSLIGFGHIYRLLALADILRRDYHLVFALYQPGDFIEKEISNYCEEVLILPGELPFKTPDEITAADAFDFDLDEVLQGEEIVVLDGYYFGTAYQQAVKKKGCKLVCIDDQAINYFYADAVINHAPGIEESIYKKAPYTKLYKGLEYAILRKSFFEPFTEGAKESGDVFISLGGSDYFQITSKLVLLLQQQPQFHVLHIMCSSDFPKIMMDELVLMSQQSAQVKLHQNLSATEIVALMDSCEYAFVSASTVLLEAYARGLKCFAGFYTDNQLFIYNGFIKENKAIGLQNLKELTAEKINDSLPDAATVNTGNAKNNLDSKPSNNLMDIFILLNLQLRKAGPEDAALYFEWANDEDVRENSINQQAIIWENHKAWFEKKIISADAKLFVLEYFNKPVGQIRIELNEEGYWLIGFSVNKANRGFGFGKKIVQLLVEKEPSLKYQAYVKINNLTSNKSFERNGFLLNKNELLNNELYNVFQY